MREVWKGATLIWRTERAAPMVVLGTFAPFSLNPAKGNPSTDPSGSTIAPEYNPSRGGTAETMPGPVGMLHPWVESAPRV